MFTAVDTGPAQQVALSTRARTAVPTAEPAMTAGLVEKFAETLTAVGGTAHGPLPVEEALELLGQRCQERAGGAAVALSTGDPVVQQLGAEVRLTAAGLDVLT